MSQEKQQNEYFDNIINKIMACKEFESADAQYITSIMKWAKINGCKIICPEKVHVEIKKEEEKEEEQWGSIFIKDGDCEIESTLKTPKTTNTKHSSNRGRTLGNPGVAMVRGKNLHISYPEEVDPEEAKSRIREKMEGAVIKSVGPCDFNVYRETKLSVSSAKMLSVSGKTPIVRSFSYDMLKGNFKKSNNDEGATAILAFLEDRSSDNTRKLEKVLKEALENIKVLYYSEYVLSCIFFGFLNCLGVKTGWRNFELYSIDTKMEDYSLGDVVSVFRCDLILFYKGGLYIIEFKYKYNRPQNMAKEAMVCINEKGYVGKVTEFIQVCYPKEFAELTFVCSVGVGYNNHDNAIKCDMEHSEHQINPLPDEEVVRRRKLLEKTKSINFLNKKRNRESKSKKKCWSKMGK